MKWTSISTSWFETHHCTRVAPIIWLSKLRLAALTHGILEDQRILGRYIKAGDPLPDLDPNYPQLGDRKGGWLPQNVYISNENGRKLVFFLIWRDCIVWYQGNFWKHILLYMYICIYNRHGFLKEWWISQFVAIQKGADKSGIDLWFISLLTNTEWVQWTADFNRVIQMILDLFIRMPF